MELSELLPYLGEVADLITLVRSMQTGVNNHGQSISALNTGRIARGRPVVGSWLTYALGSESQDLPAYCVLTDPGRPAGARGRQLADRLAPVALPGDGRPPVGAPHPEPRPAVAPPGPPATAVPRLPRPAQPRPPGRPPRRARPRRPGRQLRAGRPDADRRQGGARHLPRVGGDAPHVRARRPGDARVRQPLPDRPPPGRARRPVRPGLHGQSELGPSRRNPQGAAPDVPAGRPPVGAPWSRTSSSAGCSTRRWSSGAARWAVCR